MDISAVEHKNQRKLRKNISNKLKFKYIYINKINKWEWEWDAGRKTLNNKFQGIGEWRYGKINKSFGLFKDVKMISRIQDEKIK